MNFFEQQQSARERTRLFVLLFTLATLAVVAVTNLAVLAVIAVFLLQGHEPLAPSAWLTAHPQAVVLTTLVTLGAIGAAIFFRLASLSRGGSAVAQELGGTLVYGEPSDPRLRQLRNIVEEMAIAAGIPVPKLYVLEGEAGINAFAAGFTPSDAAIAVTRGALETLTRDELQGVIGHEFSHILNGDMRLNTRLLGVTFGILVIALTGRMILRGMARVRLRGSGRGGGGAILAAFAAGLALVVIGYVGVLFARLIKAAVSRSCETLADASAVQFTRNPQGLAGALKKIAAAPLRATLVSAESEEVSHMLIAGGEGVFGSLFASHPPILARIRALDPHFTPAELRNIRLAPMTAEPTPPPAAAPASPAAFAPLAVAAAAGTITPAALAAAPARAREIPEALRAAAHSPEQALSLALALVLYADAATRGRQLKRIGEILPHASLPGIETLANQIAGLDRALRLPLLELLFPALRQRSLEERRRLVVLIDELSRADGRVSAYDYALARLVRLHLSDNLAPRAAVRGGPAPKLYALRAEAQVLLSVLAQAGNDGEFAARGAYEAGARRLLPMDTPPYAPPSPWILPLDRALSRLDALPPLSKQALVEALALTVTHDRRVTLAETELLRVICASLHCPLPPLVPQAA